MSTVLRGLGPQPRWVYWFRRALVGLAAVLVLVLVWALFLRGDGGGEEPTAPTPPADEAATDEPTGEASTPADASRTCAASELQVALTADATSYPAGATPTFTVTITNTGTTGCTVDAGTASLDLLVTSGADRIWSSLDCAVQGAEGAERMLLLAPGAQEAAAVPWSRIRSDATCSSGLPEPRPGTYHAKATLVGAESNDLVFTLE